MMFASLGKTPRPRGNMPFAGVGRTLSENAELQMRERGVLAEMYASRGHDWNQILFGFDLQQKPIVLNREALHGHWGIFGPSGDGKSLSASVIRRQLIKQARLEKAQGKKSFSVLTLDFKPSMVPFFLDRLYAEQEDYDTEPLLCRWFDSSPDASTFLFNPMFWKLYQRLTSADQGAYHAMALGFDSGGGDNADFFSDMNWSAIQRLIHEGNPSSYAELVAYSLMPIEDLSEKLHIARHDCECMRHCFIRVGEVARNLGILPSREYPFGVDEAVLDNAIDMGDLLTVPQVAYFRLHALKDALGSRALGCYAITQLFHAAERIPKKERLPIYLFIDESQILAGEESLKHWLEMARELDIHICLISLSLGLWPKEMQDLIMNSTRVKLFLGAPDETTSKAIQHLSGTKFETQRSTSKTLNFNCTFAGGDELTGYNLGTRDAPTEVPGISRNEIINVGYRDELGVMVVSRKVGGSRTRLANGQAFRFKRVFPTDKKTHDALFHQELPQVPGSFIPTSLETLLDAPAMLAEQTKKAIRHRQAKRINGKGKTKHKNTPAKETTHDDIATRILREQMRRKKS